MPSLTRGLSVLALLFGSPAVSLVAHAGLAAGAAHAEEPQHGGASEADLRRRVEDQRRLLEAQEAQLRSQEARIEQLEAALIAVQRELKELHAPGEESAPVGEPLPQVASVGQPSAPESPVTLQPEMDTTVHAGDFPGSIGIPGSDAALRVGGQVHVTQVINTDALGVDDRFVTSAIPVEGEEVAGEGRRTHVSAVGTRFNLDFRAPTGVGPVRAFVEGDFAGPSDTLRLRHAFGRWADFLVGQTWSTFSDPRTEPYGIDREGLNAISLFRQVQLRWERGLGERTRLAFALEDPRCSVTGAECISRYADFVARAQWQQLRLGARTGHIQLAAVVRRLVAESLDGEVATTADTDAWGVSLSGSWLTTPLGEEDRVKFATYYGRGIGSYITDLATEGGQDAFYDPATGHLEALEVAAAYVGYERLWAPRWRSTFTAGMVHVDNFATQPDDAYRRTLRYSLNLIFSPIPRLDIVAEFLTGERENKDGKRGEASQLQVGTRWLF